jgi:bifunctional enzyme CysN/CysC
LNSPSETKGLLRFLTAGSVDDGKSTLIGRLLYESEGVYEDQLESVEKASARKGGKLDLSLITDGLQAEREQAITIDVAYRYFSTAKRKFIIADTPGHEQYTRNMVCGASTADLAVLLVDARKGVLEQTRRHLYLLWLLGIRLVVLAVNKMDLVAYDQHCFADIQESFAVLTAPLKGMTTFSIPLSALTGDNVVQRSPKLSWYTGPALLELLETVPVGQDRESEGLRFPVQSVFRPGSDFRGYAGQIVAGSVKPGQPVVALPSGLTTSIDQVVLHKQLLDEASAPQSIVLTLKDHIDLSRGDMLVDPENMPNVSNRFMAELIWMSASPLQRNVPYLIKHATQVLCCNIREIVYRVDVQSFARAEAASLSANEIGIVEIEAHKPMFFDFYSANRAMGSFILVDPTTNDTVAAGIMSERAAAAQGSIEHASPARLSAREPDGLAVWFTGLSGAGKTTICNVVSTELMAQGFRVEVLDGDIIRNRLNSDLGFSQRDRDENVRRLGFLAELLVRHGVIVLVAAISPYRATREELRKNIPGFLEVYVNAPLAVCEQRDPKGLYRRARNGEISGFTGIDHPYEAPITPDVECRTQEETTTRSANKVIEAIEEHFRSLRSTPFSQKHCREAMNTSFEQPHVQTQSQSL